MSELCSEVHTGLEKLGNRLSVLQDSSLNHNALLSTLCQQSGAASRHSKPMLPWLPPLGSPLHRPHQPHRPSATSRLLRLFLRSVASRFTAPLLLLIPLSPLRDHRHRIGIPPRLKVCLYAIITISANQATAPGPILCASSSQSGVVSRPPSRAPSRALSAGGGSRGGSRPRT